MADRLPYSTALAEGRLDAFIAQAEAQGIEPADSSQLDAIVTRITAPHRQLKCGPRDEHQQVSEWQ